MISGDAWIIGAAMTRFGRFPDGDLLDLASEAAIAALAGGGCATGTVGVRSLDNEAEGDLGRRLPKEIGQTGIPVRTVVAEDATAVLSLAAGKRDTTLAVGEQKTGTVSLPGGFAQADIEYALKHGATEVRFARVAQKNHAHSVLNPLVQYRGELSLLEILNAEVVVYPDTVPMCCPPGDGAAAVVLASDTKLRTLDPDVRRRAVKISASALTSDPWSDSDQVGPDLSALTRRAADAVYEQAVLGPEDLDLVELHDCFASAELTQCDDLGLCEPGGAGDFTDSGAPWREGRMPVNISGGLLSKGHPIGAMGTANLVEVTARLRCEAGGRQIEGAKVGLTHVVGPDSPYAVHIREARTAEVA